MAQLPHISIIGGGPAGLRAVEVAAEGGAAVTLFEAKPSVGRKFLVAGRGGLNLTHNEPDGPFSTRYLGPHMPGDTWPSLLAEFGPQAVAAWAARLGVETFAASTGRVYPRELKAAPLLRRWVSRLRTLGVQFAVNHRWTGISPGPPLRVDFSENGVSRSIATDAVILALGGGSWPQTGSDGLWFGVLQQHGIALSPFAPANCGWEVDWPPAVLASAEGQPLKNVEVKAGDAKIGGELLVTAYGLEGGAIYRLGPVLRAMPAPELTIDFKPAFTPARLVAKFGATGKAKRDFLAEAAQRWRLSDAARAIVGMHGPFESVESVAAVVKRCPIRLQRPRPLAEAISSSGGVCWCELDSNLMLRKLPGVFVAGEMIDWEAPTGGYLLQGCFATGTRAGRAATEFAAVRGAAAHPSQ